MLYNNGDKDITLTDRISLGKIDFDTIQTVDFLRSVYKSTRYEEMARSGWTNDQIDRFLDQQFQFQHIGYTTQYTGAQFYIILFDRTKSGRLYMDYGEREIRIIDIALLNKFRGKKIGTTIINILKAEAKELAKPVTLHVETVNRARGLYERLGFRIKTNDGVYILMEFTP